MRYAAKMCENPSVIIKQRVQSVIPDCASNLKNQDRLQQFLDLRSHLFSIAYRMLGSASDAEDMLQDCFLRWQRASDLEVQSSRAFLVTIITRLCINLLQSTRKKREEYVGEWLPEPVFTGANADPSRAIQVEESVGFAFLVLLERLTPPERAVFLLHEVFDYDYSDIGEVLDYSEPNCRQILRRARVHLGEQRSRFDACPREREKLFRQFISAATSGDADGLVALLSREVAFHSDGGGKAQALLQPVQGADSVARLLLNWFKKSITTTSQGQPVEVNGQPGIVGYHEGRPFSVVTADIVDGQIHNIYVVTNPEKLAGLHLPAPRNIA